MPRYVAFFGSLNVGGNRLTMADLRQALEREEFERVETVVASGNVLFNHDERPTDGLEAKLAHVLLDRFDIQSFATVRSRDEVAAAITDNPFTGAGEDMLVHTLFLERAIEPQQFEKLVTDYDGRGPERLAQGDRSVYINYVTGVGNSRLTNAFMERRLGSRSTARNVRSLARILAKMDES